VAEALVVVDFQNDFTPGGALAVPAGDEIADRVNELIDSGRFDLVVATRDWHPPDHGSFNSAHPPGPWPPHCVQGTPGAELHPSLAREKVDVVLDKGQDPGTDGYSAFDGTDFAALLRERGIDRITLAGLATDYCVKNTALDALREGFEVEVDRKGVRGIDVTPGDVEKAIAEVTAAGGRVA
jgi:nicotinamidase/pyrazinamidase